MIEFYDILYGKIELPDWIGPFIKLPEFLRLRGVRLSNVDSYQFKDFNGPTRWEHSIAVAFLATKCAEFKRLAKGDKIRLILSALLHDIATPPFAHTVEYVLENFDHEYESKRLLSSSSSDVYAPDSPIFESELPQFSSALKRLNKELNVNISVDEIAQMVIGEGELGYLIHGTLDLDNADNVIRSALHLGMKINSQLPLDLVNWLAKQEHIPVDLEKIKDSTVQSWLNCRSQLYSNFYYSSDEEIGRQAFLQHIMRIALKEDYPRQSLIWNTDEFVLSDLSKYKSKNNDLPYSLNTLISKYRLLECPVKIAHIDINDEDLLRILKTPQAVSWVESELTTPNFEAMVTVNVLRCKANNHKDLFPPSPGNIMVFKLGSDINIKSMPAWVQEIISNDNPKRIKEYLNNAINSKLKKWAEEKPWLTMNQKRRKNIVANLDYCKDWSFSLTTNDNLHQYPSTFVYAIPSNFINALGLLQDDLIVDPFGGIGQTAVEAVKKGYHVITADSNSFACMYSRAKLTYLSSEKRDALRKLGIDTFASCQSSETPDIENIDKWFHPTTLKELCRIWQYIKYRKDETTKQFLKVCFSAILNSCTARKGKHHTYFADNTPLPAGLKKPPYENAYLLFISKVNNNLNVLERLYATIKRNGCDPYKEMNKSKVLQLDVTKACPEDFGIKLNTASAIITSPPYLCMADYTYGLRLSYYWIMPDKLLPDFETEIGARRYRSRGCVVDEYFEKLQKFAILSSRVIRQGGFLATVYGAPTANAFKKLDVYKEFDTILEKAGFKFLWKQRRTLSNKRGYGCMDTERVAVHQLE